MTDREFEKLVEEVAGEISHKDMMIMKAYCAIEKGEPKTSVLSRCGLSEQEYDSNKRVFYTPKNYEYGKRFV